MKIVVPGGTGQVGTVLAQAFHERGDEVVVLSRQPRSTPWRTVIWDARTLGDWAAEIDGADAVINLAGRSVNCRYTPANRRTITESRVDSTRVIGEAIAGSKCPPRVWLQASTATLYAHRYDAPNDEATGIIGGTEPDLPDTWKFSIDVATAWERTLDEAQTPSTRKIKLRSAILMSPSAGGAFSVLLGLVRRGLGGRQGSGQQFVSWIHDADFVRAIAWLLEHEAIEGVVNLTSPHPLPNADFMQALRKAWGIPFGLMVPAWLLEIGAIPLRTETELVLKSRRVVPTRLLAEGFTFQFPCWPEAAKDLCQRWRKGEQSIMITAAISEKPDLIKPIVFFDGVCGMCNAAVDLLLRLDRHHRVLFAPLQGETARRMLPPLAHDLREWSTLYWDEAGVHEQTDALLTVFRRIGGIGKLLSLARIIPRPVRDSAYRLIVRNRYRLSRKRPVCRIPTASERTRFLP